MLNVESQKLLASAILAEILKLNRVTRGGGSCGFLPLFEGYIMSGWGGGGTST